MAVRSVGVGTQLGRQARVLGPSGCGTGRRPRSRGGRSLFQGDEVEKKSTLYSGPTRVFTEHLCTKI